MNIRKKQQEPDRRRDQLPKSTMRAERYRYHSNRSDIEHFNTGKDRIKPSGLLGKAPTLLAVAVIIISALYLLWLDTMPRIRTPEAEVTLLQDTEVYEQGVAEILSSSPLNLSKVTINTKQVSDQIKNRFPEISDAVVTIPIASHKPIIDVRSKQPAIILNSQDGPYVIDTSGAVLVRVSDLANVGSFSLPIVIDQSGIEIESGKKVLTSDTVAFIGQLMYQFNEADRVVDTLLLPGQPNELRVTLRGSSYFVKFDMSRDARTQAGTVFAVEQRLGSDGKTPGEYIDVRVAEKAFYK